MKLFEKLTLHHCGSVPLETERLELRRFAMSDAQAMFERWAHDPQVTRYLMWRAHRDVRDTEDTLRYWESQYHHKDFYEWAILLKGQALPIGSIGVSKVKGQTRVMEFGYCIGRPWWGNGICAEAGKAVLQLMFETVGCTGMIAMYAQGNEASGRVMEKCGMHRKDCPLEPVHTENGRLMCVTYEISREEWEAFSSQ
jgi:ribosomal-protein-alanine N-acetyltransferase